MAYSKTEWKARQGINLNRFTKSQETSDSVLLTNTPDSITEPGTPFSAENMNHIEEGIADAHDAIEQEVSDRDTAITEAVNSEAQTRLSADQTITNNLTIETQAREDADRDINLKIPNQASADNQLADKDYVNSSITAMAARPLTYDIAGNPFPTKAALNNATLFYYQGEAVNPTDNDYVVVQADETQAGGQVRYGYAVGVWVFRYKINDAPFTAAQVAALNSGATSEIISSVPGKAPLASPVFTENPTAPTPAATDNDTSIATTAFVRNATYTLPDEAESTTLPSTSAGTLLSKIQSLRKNIKYLFSHITGVNYSTTEQDTGRKWIDGRAIYQKTIQWVLPIPDPSDVIFNTSTQCTRVLKAEINDDNAGNIPWTVSIASGGLNLNCRGIRWTVGTTLYITVWYTKD